MGIILSVSLPDEIYDLIRSAEDENPRIKRSAVIALLIRNGHARLMELQEREKEEAGRDRKEVNE
jgi:hypothetical protein